MKRQSVISMVVMSLVLMAGSAQAADGTKVKPLYARLGGKGAITAVVETFVRNVGGDKRINGFFSGTDLT